MGVGFAKDGEAAMRNNRKLKNATKDKYFKKHTYKSNRNNNLNLRPASKAELIRIKNKLAKQSMKENNRVIMVATIILIVLGYLLFF